MNERYDIYFSGQVMDGFDTEHVRAELARLFNADQPTLDKLFSGKAHIIKRNCDKATAQKYKRALERAGALPIIKAATAESQPQQGASPTLSAAERIAALAAAPDQLRYRDSASAVASPAPEGDTAVTDGHIGLTPPGTEVLREEERAKPLVREIDTSGLHVDASAERLSQESPPPSVTVNTAHLSMAAVGESIPNLPSDKTPLTPDLTGLSLSDAADFSDCAPPEPTAPALDLSGLSLDPAGTEILDERLRKHETGTPPNTDHISLEDG